VKTKIDRPMFEVRASPIHGLGVFALRRIRKGTRIIAYLGERITPDEADRRYDDDSMAHHHTFLFVVDDETVIDARVDGNDARFINHACQPNCESVVTNGTIYIVATQTIQAGTELTYDYHLTRPGRRRKGWKRLYACHCGSPKCRGTLLDSGEGRTR
jgi:uncharacterized protein